MKDPAHFAKTLARLHALKARHGLDVLLLASGDRYCSDYASDADRVLARLTGFTIGGALLALLPEGRFALFAIEPFREQAEREVGDLFPYIYVGSDLVPPGRWLADTLAAPARIGVDGSRRSATWMAAFRAPLDAAGFEIVQLVPEAIDAALDHHEPPRRPIEVHPLEVSGEPSIGKCSRMARTLAAHGADGLLVGNLSNIAWLLNIRGRDLGGRDVTANPVSKCRLLLLADGSATLFCDLAQVGDDVRRHLSHVAIRPEADFTDVVGRLAPRLWIDPERTPSFLADDLGERHDLLVAPDPITLARCRKNPTELAGAREAYRHASLSLIRVLSWIEAERLAGREVREFAVRQRLATEHARRPDYKMESFPAIVAGGPRGAMLNYIPTQDNDHPLAPGELCLIDTGGHYSCGTTDITRTLVLADEATAEQRRLYTLTLKAHIANVETRFPVGTTGLQLDAVWRAPLWRQGWDFFHGVGHGVGSCLDVHEAPIILNQRRPSNEPLTEAMVIAADSCLYRVGEFGLRIENAFVVAAADGADGGDWLRLHIISLVPFDRRLIDWNSLEPSELAWLASYCERLLAELPELGEAERAWVIRQFEHAPGNLKLN